jgi:L-serine dehydratase
MNIAHMEVGRKEKGKMALMVIEVDQMFDEKLINELKSLPNVTQVSTLAN